MNKFEIYLCDVPPCVWKILSLYLDRRIDGPCQIEQADINDDESIDIFDIIEVINIIFN